MFRNIKERAWSGIFYCRDFGKKFFYFLFHAGYVEIADDGNGLEVGAVPLTVKVFDSLIFEVLDHIQGADDIPYSIF